MATISIVVPVLNEQDSIAAFLEAFEGVDARAGVDFEIIFIDDGSTDATADVIKDLMIDDDRVHLIRLSRNFGKEAALTAGLKFSTGAAVIPMDVDLQDPPSLIPELVEKWREGFLVVHAVRRTRGKDTFLKRTSASLFYSLMQKLSRVDIPINGGDFRLMDRKVVKSILKFPERNRFMKGIMSAAGYPSTSVFYDRTERGEGKSRFNFWKLWNFALDGITGFSTFPIRIWTYLGIMIALFSFVFASWIVLRTLIWGDEVPGFASTVTIILFLGGIQIFGIGVLGEYIGRIFEEVKRRPIYIVSELHGFPERRRRSRSRGMSEQVAQDSSEEQVLSEKQD